ncbi:MAG: bifunctional diguanylate cyclase/phosphodiesterase [Roseiarcus sp.]
MQDIESLSGCEAPARGEREFTPSSEAQDGSAAESSRGLDPRSILGSLNAVVYDWDIASDRLSWGANVGETLAAFSAACLKTGAAFAELVTADSESSRFQAINNASARDEGEGAPYRIVYRLARPDGARCAVEDFGRWFADAHGRPARAHGVLRVLQRNEESRFCPAEATSREREGALASRRNFNEALESRFAHARPGGAIFAVLIVGVENLAELNRRHGYEATDEVIATVGRRLGANVRSIDEVAHYAGGKFAVLLSTGSPEQLAMAAPRLARRVNAEPFETAVGAVQASVRVGAALAPRHGRNACRLLQRAEEAFEQAAGEANRYALYAPGQALSEAQRREAAIADEIVSALNQRRIVLAYQPVVPTKAARTAFVEALLRVRQDDGGLVGPEVLLPVAEKLGLVAQLDQRVLELALDRLTAEPDLRVAVNISVVTLRAPDWVDRLKAALGARPGTAQRLIVEIVETLAIEPIDEAVRIIGRMKALGVAIAMDDFGAGHTSFRNLRRLGVDIVKIDGAFVQNVARSVDDRFFVRTLAELARHLGIETVAEWVENAEARRLLSEWEIDYLQGHFLGRPEIHEPRAAEPRLALGGA